LSNFLSGTSQKIIRLSLKNAESPDKVKSAIFSFFDKFVEASLSSVSLKKAGETVST